MPLPSCLNWCPTMLVDLVLIGMATWNVTRLLNRDNGPDMILERMRYRLGARRDENDKQTARDGSWGQWIICHGCLARSVAVALCVVWAVSPGMARAISLPLAASTISIWLDGRIKG